MRRKGLEARKLQQIFQLLQSEMGAQHWWPAGSAFEVVVGAYLTQNTNWGNVEQAMENLRAAGALSVSGIREVATEELERLVRPSGYFRQKAARLKSFVAHLDAYHGGSLEALFAQPIETLRGELLGLTGIGPETADSILLYAANREVFVVDTYTRRILERHEIAAAGTGYEEIRLAVEKALADMEGVEGQSEVQRQEQSQSTQIGQERTKPAPDEQSPKAAKGDTTQDGGAFEARARSPHARLVVPHAPSVASAMERSELAQRYNEFHALLVQTAKHYCAKSEPHCESCPLRTLLPPRLRSS